MFHDFSYMHYMCWWHVRYSSKFTSHIFLLIPMNNSLNFRNGMETHPPVLKPGLCYYMHSTSIQIITPRHYQGTVVQYKEQDKARTLQNFRPWPSTTRELDLDDDGRTSSGPLPLILHSFVAICRWLPRSRVVDKPAMTAGNFAQAFTK